MKKQLIIIAGSALLMLSSCFHRDDMSITVWDDEDELEMEASYHANKTHRVEAYLNDRLLGNTTRLRRHREFDEDITLEDNTTFHLNAYPGELRIRIDKRENSEEACEKIRQVCEELSELISEN